MNHIPQFRSADEPGRLRALHRYDVLDTPPEKEFADIIQLVKSIFGLPIVAVSLIDSHRQWLKASAGDVPVEIPRAISFCSHTIQERVALPVPNAQQDPRFSANPFVTEGGLRCYLGVPLTTPDGYNVGALCVAGSEPRTFSAADIGVLQSFGKLVVSQLELRQIARSDGLTAALTRRAFQEQLDKALETGRTVSLVLLDIDYFKMINDRFGHPAGDIVLRGVADILRTDPVPGEALGRIGGEEFGLLLPDCERDAALARAETLRRAVAAALWPALENTTVTISLGVATRRGGENSAHLMNRADIALYGAKRSGRNKTVEAGMESCAPV